VINIKLTSLNPIDTKYELYYKIISPTSSTNLVDGGHIITDENATIGTILAEETKEIQLVLNNTGKDEIVVEIGLKAGLVHNEVELVSEEISLNKKAYQKFYIYAYTGDYQMFTAPVDGSYRIELWGASGGGTSSGKGAYTKGEITLNQGTPLYLYVGESGETTQHAVFNNGNKSMSLSYDGKSG